MLLYIGSNNESSFSLKQNRTIAPLPTFAPLCRRSRCFPLLKVLNGGVSSYASDMMVWEALSLEVSWASEARGQDIYRRVVIKQERPTMPADALADIADLVRGYWKAQREKRLQFSQMMESMKARRKPDV